LDAEKLKAATNLSLVKRKTVETSIILLRATMAVYCRGCGPVEKRRQALEMAPNTSDK